MKHKAQMRIAAVGATLFIFGLLLLLGFGLLAVCNVFFGSIEYTILNALLAVFGGFAAAFAVAFVVDMGVRLAGGDQ